MYFRFRFIRVTLLEFSASASLSNFGADAKSSSSAEYESANFVLLSGGSKRFVSTVAEGNAIFSRRTQATKSSRFRTGFGCHKYANVHGEPTACARRCRPFNLQIDALVKRHSLHGALVKPKMLTTDLL